MDAAHFRLALATFCMLVWAPLATAADNPAADNPAADKPAVLSDTDKKYLEELLEEFLFDPAGAERVAIKVELRSVWGDAEAIDQHGWLVAAKDGKPARVCFTDGASIVAPAEGKLKKVDFVAVCRGRYLQPPKPAKDEVDRHDRRQLMGETAIGMLRENDLALAAWLHRLGQGDLAARALAVARQQEQRRREGEGDARQRLRSDLAWAAFAGLVHAYMVRADEEALAHGERLLRLYARVPGDSLEQGPRIVAELKRRQQKGTFGKTPGGELPQGFDGWDPQRKVVWLIESLDEVDARQWSQPGGVDLSSDFRVEALIRVGDAAIPALIDALEKDERLTRSVHFWRDFSRDRTVLGVREAVLTAIMSILRVRVFRARSTGDNFTAHGEEGVKQAVKELRAYWQKYGKLPFDERMMRVLTDAKADFEDRREAAVNLGTLTEDRRLGTTVFSDVRVGDAPRVNPAVAKFSQPTTADAMVAALDADLKNHDAGPPRGNADLKDYDRRQIEDTYLSAILSLGDRRFATEAARRSGAAKELRQRRLWAQVAHHLGEEPPLKKLAEEFGAGQIKPPPGDQDYNELTEVVGALVEAETPDAGRALVALADPQHPLHKAAAREILEGRSRGFDEGPWLRHPFGLTILRRALDDVTPTGATYVIAGGSLCREYANGSSGESVPDFLADPQLRVERAPERVCDTAANKLAEVVVGLPVFHPLLKDAAQRMSSFKATYDRFASSYRLATAQELDLLGRWSRDVCYLPDIRLLGRAATEADVKAGKALFHLPGKSRPLDLELPAVAVFKRDIRPKQENDDGPPPRVLIVQAEVGGDGKPVYGVLGAHDARAASADELSEIKTLKQLEAEEETEARKAEQAPVN